MAMALGAYSTAQTNTVLIPAEPGKIIRIVTVLASAWVNAKLTLISDPGGDDQTDLTPAIHFGSARPLLARLGRTQALATGRGKALGITTGYQGVAGEVGLLIWYELVS